MSLDVVEYMVIFLVFVFFESNIFMFFNGMFVGLSGGWDLCVSCWGVWSYMVRVIVI